jgi:hypothetical protein
MTDIILEIAAVGVVPFLLAAAAMKLGGLIS